ncbi:MAG: response regulator [Anaerolineae bacterium]|nr:response regulator [Anaerolineae bacterium]
MDIAQQPAVLYVEDDLSSRQIMQILLEAEMGLREVTIFEDSHDFLSRVAALPHRPDIVLLDIHVPPHSGFEMLQMLRQNGFEKTPIVALTASVMNEEIARLRTAGFNGVVSKPVDLDTFPQMLKRLLNGESVWRISELA